MTFTPAGLAINGYFARGKHDPSLISLKCPPPSIRLIYTHAMIQRVRNIESMSKGGEGKVVGAR